MERTFTDELVDPAAAAPDRFFDRFVLNAHPVDGGPCVIVGAGLYPAADVVDGFAILVTDDEQRNLRFSTELSATGGSAVGPFSWQVVEPMRTWRVALGPNPAGFELDLTWRTRAPAWSGDVVVRGDDGAVTSSFEHLFQSGTYTGWVVVDGVRHDAEGWWGQRDRSRGVRTMSGGQGLHMWFQAQFPDRSVGFLLVEDRAHCRLLLEGAVMHVDGRLDPVVDVRHRLVFDDGLDLRSGALEVVTASGAVERIDVDASGRGGYMAGGGYGGHHGHPLGRDHLEHDAYPLDGSVGPTTLDSALVDRLARFTCDGVAGTGIYEFAHTRSRSYVYDPSL